MHATLVAAVEKPVPLVDIDATVFVQFGIFLTMAAALSALVFRPFLRVREERTRRIDGARDEARGMEERAAAALADCEARLGRAKQRGAEERLRLRAEGQAREREVISLAREAGQKALAEAQTRAAAQRDAARGPLLVEAEQIARRIVAKVVGREPG